MAALVFRALDEHRVVLHDLRLRGEGKETSHQIDVMVDRPEGARRVIVECRDKESGNKLQLRDVRHFKGVLVQIDAEGVMVTTEGFTRDAVKYARDEGITLAILRGFRDDEDSEGRLREVVITVVAYIADEQSLTAQVLTTDPNVDTSQLIGCNPHEVRLTDSEGRLVRTLGQVVQEALADPTAQKEGPVEIIREFNPPLTITIPESGEVLMRAVVVGANKERYEDVVKVTAGSRVTELVLESLDGLVSQVIFDDQLQRFTFDQDGVVGP